MEVSALERPPETMAASQPSQCVAFQLPQSTASEDGWGPSPDAPLPELGLAIPFQPYNKGEKVSNISDWNPAQWQSNKRRSDSRPQSAQSAFAYVAEVETGFQSVESAPVYKPKDGRRKYKKFSYSNRRPRPVANRRFGHRAVKVTGRASEKKKLNQTRKRNWNVPDERFPSVPIDPSWTDVATIRFQNLQGLGLRVEGETLEDAGSLPSYDRKLDRIRPNIPVRIPIVERNAERIADNLNPAATQDPVLKELRAKKSGNIYTTDNVLATLMSAPKSVQSWDILIRVENGDIVLDKRPGSELDLLTVNESWHESFEQDENSVNHPDRLRHEASLLNYNFRRYSTRGPLAESDIWSPSDKKSPFAGDEVAGAGLCRYRRWVVGDGLRVVSRTRLDGFIESKRGRETVLLRALNEFDQSIDSAISWKSSIHAQPEAVLAAELRKNPNRLCRWLAEAYISGAQQIRLGFISRSNMHSNAQHDILLVQRFKPQTLATSLNITPHSLWGSLNLILQEIKEHCSEDGTYVLVKDPNSSALKIYNCHNNPPQKE